jgi:hypothetical protein
VFTYKNIIIVYSIRYTSLHIRVHMSRQHQNHKYVISTKSPFLDTLKNHRDYHDYIGQVRDNWEANQALPIIPSEVLKDRLRFSQGIHPPPCICVITADYRQPVSCQHVLCPDDLPKTYFCGECSTATLVSNNYQGSFETVLCHRCQVIKKLRLIMSDMSITPDELCLVEDETYVSFSDSDSDSSESCSRSVRPCETIDSDSDSEYCARDVHHCATCETRDSASDSEYEEP